MVFRIYWRLILLHKRAFRNVLVSCTSRIKVHYMAGHIGLSLTTVSKGLIF